MDVLMPQLGETVAEGKISAWFRSVGDRVAAGDNLFEVETDKTAMEVPTTSGGIVAEIRVAAGETVPVGTVVAVISDGDGAVAGTAPAPTAVTRPPGPAQRAPAAGTTTPAMAPAAVAAIPMRGVFDPFNEVRLPERGYGPARLASGIEVTPLARRLAVESGIDLRAVSGSGPRGRVVARDVEHAHPPSGSATSALLGKGASSGPALFDIVPHDRARREAGFALAAAKRAIPQFVVRRDVRLDAVLRLIAEINAVDAAFGVGLVHCLAKALALALIRVPDANVQWADDHMLKFRQADILVATGPGRGSLIRSAERNGLAAISAATRSSGDVPRDGVSAVWDMSAAGVSAISVPVRPPNTTALTVGAVERRAVADGDRIAVATCATLTLTCDHRAIDGAVGARLIGACAALLERPLALVL